MIAMTPELTAYLDEWNAEHKRMYDEKLGTPRQLLTKFDAVDHDNSTPQTTPPTAPLGLCRRAPT